MKALTCPIFLFFCISAIVDKLNLRVKRKGHLVNISFVTNKNGVLSLPETWKISQNIKFCMNMRCFDQFYSLYVTIWQQTPEHLFQNLGSESRTCRKFYFPLKKYGGRIFFRKWWNSKSGQKLWFRFCWLIINRPGVARAVL